jgi:predicted  nucleic acid-binding Zn-ribbon protein
MEIARERDTLKTQITELQTRIMLLDVDMWELRKENERLQDELNLANEALRRAFKPQ